MSDDVGDHEPDALAQTEGALDAETVRLTGRRMPGMREAFPDGTLADATFDDQTQGDEHRDPPAHAPTGVPEPIERLEVTHPSPERGGSDAQPAGDSQPQPRRDVPGLR